MSNDENIQDQPQIRDTTHAPASAAAGRLLLLLLLRLLLSRVSARCPFRHHALDLQDALHDVQCLLLLGRWAFCRSRHAAAVSRTSGMVLKRESGQLSCPAAVATRTPMGVNPPT